MRLDRRLATVLIVVGLLIVTIAGAAVFLGIPRIQLSSEPTEADAVTLYQNGLAFVELTRNFTAAGGDAVLVFAVPMTTVLPSLTIEGAGVVVREVRSSLAASPIIQPGDQVVVHFGPQTFRGTVLSMEGNQLLLQRDAGTILIDVGKADAIEVQGREVKPTGPGSAEVLALVNAPRGDHSVRLTYLARGPGWTPSYRMEMVSAAFAFDASLTGLEDWANVTLDLVSGSPNVVASLQPGPGPQPPVFRAETAAAGGGAGFAEDSGIGASAPLGGLHRYHLDRPVTLQRGETVRLQVLDGSVDVTRRFHNVEAGTGFGSVAGARQDVFVLERAELRNTLTEPLPPGVVRFYQNGTWIGEDLLPATARGDRSNVTLSRSEEVKARLVLTQFQGTLDRDTATYVLTVENFKQQAVDLRAALNFPSFRTNLLSAEPEPDERPGTTLVWNRPLPAGGTLTFRIQYETLRNR